MLIYFLFKALSSVCHRKWVHVFFSRWLNSFLQVFNYNLLGSPGKQTLTPMYISLTEVIYHIHMKPKCTQLGIWIMGIILGSNIYHDYLSVITRMIINSPVTYWPIVKSFQGYQAPTLVSFKGTEPSLLTHSSHLLLNLRKWTILPQNTMILFIF